MEDTKDFLSQFMTSGVCLGLYKISHECHFMIGFDLFVHWCTFMNIIAFINFNNRVLAVHGACIPLEEDNANEIKEENIVKITEKFLSSQFSCLENYV